MENTGSNPPHTTQSADDLMSILLNETIRQLNIPGTPAPLRPTAIPPLPTAILPTPPITPRINNRHFNRLLDTAYDSMYNYNLVMQTYNNNMTSMLNYITESLHIINANSRHDPPLPVPRSPIVTARHVPPTPPPSVSRNEPRTFGSQAPDSTFLFSYIFEPLYAQSDQNENTRPMTRTEILSNTRTFSYEENSLPEDRRTCPIGMDTFQQGDVLCEIRGCGHIFRRLTLVNWLQRSSRCPVCRYNICEFQSSGRANVIPQPNIISQPIPPINETGLRINNDIEDNHGDSDGEDSDGEDSDIEMDASVD